MGPTCSTLDCYRRAAWRYDTPGSVPITVYLCEKHALASTVPCVRLQSSLNPLPPSATRND